MVHKDIELERIPVRIVLLDHLLRLSFFSFIKLWILGNCRMWSCTFRSFPFLLMELVTQNNFSYEILSQCQGRRECFSLPSNSCWIHWFGACLLLDWAKCDSRINNTAPKTEVVKMMDRASVVLELFLGGVLDRLKQINRTKVAEESDKAGTIW